MSSILSRIYNRKSVIVFGVVVTTYLVYRYYKSRRRRDTFADEDAFHREIRRRRVEKLVELRDKLEQLLGSLDNFQPELPDTEDDECIVCNSAKAIIQTYPCKHRVLCRRCFVRTLQVAVNDLNLPLKCVVCRTRIQTLDRDRHEGTTPLELLA
ncbi:uncharacterized protein LOC111326235 [Stylophora pistillata]|uniref:RING-type domain-containing protein n=1 Tax=Stylophora pistillata TaxID=50429 RepID=A0A2B4SHT1_STYPI|nr:uncharacterized protein LOC111326235 [Stylophora pistillata]XP_022785915.1 uncharacterized protein LOC111326235 [Stylophora pistillata]XP_022785916.1 uncharacterized protein LOC111326235 [Stylophora pistillata]PFX28420.1 hypothetical protein AWC38_SpisGene6847 [Stylophora pistillata]